MTKTEKAKQRFHDALLKHGAENTGLIAMELDVAYDSVKHAIRVLRNEGRIVALGSRKERSTAACPVCGVRFYANKTKGGRYGHINETGCPHCRRSPRDRARAKLQEMFERNAPTQEIAEAFGISRFRVRVERNNWNREGHVTAIGVGHGRRKYAGEKCTVCPNCGGEKSPGATMCLECDQERYRETLKPLHSEQHRKVVLLAGELGHVPTARQGAEAWGVAKDTANRWIRRVYGSDPRPEGYHRHEPRPLPEVPA